MPKNELRGAEDIERVLKALPRQIATPVLMRSLTAGARLIAAEARRLVRKRTGRLAAAITVRRSTARQKRRGAGHVVIGFKGAPARRAHLTEFGTRHHRAFPFMRPALDAKAPEAIAAIGKRLGQEIAKAAERLAGKFSTSGLARRRRR